MATLCGDNVARLLIVKEIICTHYYPIGHVRDKVSNDTVSASFVKR